MASSNPAAPYLETLAYRLNNVTGKEYLPRICMSGFALEYLWHSQVEARLFGTLPPAIRRAKLKAAVTWPILFVCTKGLLLWAEKKVASIEDEKARRQKSAGMNVQG